MRFALDCGAHGLVAFGLAGEVLKLSADERRQLTDVIVDEVEGAVPVFVGAGAPSVRASVELARHAEHAGASCVVLPAPMGGALGETALVDYFVRVASAVSVPVMIQDAPAYLGVGLGPELVRQIGALAENVRLVKLEAGPVEMNHWIEHLGPEFAIWGGDGGVYLLDCVRTGAAGIIPGVDLIDFVVRAYEAEAEGDPALAEERLLRSCRCSCSRCSTRSTTTTHARSACSFGVAFSSMPRCARLRPCSGTCPWDCSNSI